VILQGTTAPYPTVASLRPSIWLPGRDWLLGTSRAVASVKGPQPRKATSTYAPCSRKWLGSISHTKENYLSAQYHRFVRRLGTNRAIVATSHSVLTIAYHMLRAKQEYHDLGPHYFETLDTARQRQTAVRRLEALGYKVTLQEITEVPLQPSSSVPRDGPSSKETLDVNKEVSA
jgi:hypothetical protein